MPCRGWGKRRDDVLIWHWKFRWWQKRCVSDLLSFRTKKGVLLVGYPRGEFGIGSLLRLSALALKEAEIPFGVFDFNPSSQASQNDHRLDERLTHLPEYSVNIFCIGADQLPLLKKILGKQFFQGRYNILYGAWELSRLPETVGCMPGRNERNLGHEQLYGPNVSAIHITSCIMIYSFLLFPTSWKPWSRTRFQIPENSFVFLFMFDFDSHVARKNPEAVIEAFKLAFPCIFQHSLPLWSSSPSTVKRHEKEWNRCLKNKIGWRLKNFANSRSAASF